MVSSTAVSGSGSYKGNFSFQLHFNRLLLAAVPAKNIKIHCVQLRIDHGNLVICQNDIARFKVLFQTFNLAGTGNRHDIGLFC